MDFLVSNVTFLHSSGELLTATIWHLKGALNGMQSMPFLRWPGLIRSNTPFQLSDLVLEFFKISLACVI